MFIIDYIKSLFDKKRELQVIRQNNSFIIGDGNKNFVRLFRNNHGKMLIEFNGDISFIVSGNLQVTTANEINVASYKDINIDTVNSHLNLNCRLAKQIRNNPDSVEYREKAKTILNKVESLKRENKESVKKMCHICGDEHNEGENV